MPVMMRYAPTIAPTGRPREGDPRRE